MEVIYQNIEEDDEDDGFETILIPETYLHCDTDLHITPSTTEIQSKSKRIEYKDLPFMGEMTLDNSKPRRGRKPKKTNICHLIYKNYGTIVPGTPKELFQTSTTAVTAATTTTITNTNGKYGKKAIKRTTKKLKIDQPLNLCIRDDNLNRTADINFENFQTHEVINPSDEIGLQAQFQSQQPPQNEVSICKFKFTGGIKPSLEEKKMLSVDSDGNLRYFNSNGVNGSSNELRGYEFFSCSSPNSENCTENCHRHDAIKKRKTRRALHRENLEKTFKEKGFLIQTQQLESAQGATYCKFRQLRKFTRYLFRSWKDYLPNNVVVENSIGEDLLQKTD